MYKTTISICKIIGLLLIFQYNVNRRGLMCVFVTNFTMDQNNNTLTVFFYHQFLSLSNLILLNATVVDATEMSLFKYFVNY